MTDVQSDSVLRMIEARICENRMKLEFVRNKVRRASSAGRIVVSEQLQSAERQAECLLQIAEQQLDKMRQADAASWESQKRNVESACDDLAQSIKKIVARF